MHTGYPSATSGNSSTLPKPVRHRGTATPPHAGPKRVPARFFAACSAWCAPDDWLSESSLFACVAASDGVTLWQYPDRSGTRPRQPEPSAPPGCSRSAAKSKGPYLTPTHGLSHRSLAASVRYGSGMEQAWPCAAIRVRGLISQRAIRRRPRACRWAYRRISRVRPTSARHTIPPTPPRTATSPTPTPGSASAPRRGANRRGRRH